MSVLYETDLSTSRSLEMAKYVETKREQDIIAAEAGLDTAINEMVTTGKIISMKNDTYREILRLEEASVGEAERARERILAEADLERETEDMSLNKIRVLGEEATKATIEIIKVSFMNFADAIHHLFKTVEGQKQMLVFLMGASLAAFAIMLIREMSSLLFGILKKVRAQQRRSEGASVRKSCPTSPFVARELRKELAAAARQRPTPTTGQQPPRALSADNLLLLRFLRFFRSRALASLAQRTN
jgi:hypothetical protein